MTEQRDRRGLLLFGAGLAGFIGLLFFRLLFTDRVLASGDILHYFYPYRDYAAQALREGRLPLWNPYIFLGAPFLANPQAAALYPLHWPFSWLPVTKQIYWSAALHVWLLGIGAYLLARRLGQSAWGAAAAGLIVAGSGFVGGLLGHLNQLNGAAWLPWALWAVTGVEETTAVGSREWAVGKNPTPYSLLPTPHSRSLLLRRGVWLAIFVALMLLAGHTQTAFINLVGVGAWVMLPALWVAGSLQARIGRVLGGVGVFVVGVTLGACIGAAQLLPTLELSDLGLRSGGLSYVEASSFSLKPLHLPWTLLPTYAFADLSVVFDTLGYTEFVAYVGLIGLLLAAYGFWRGATTSPARWAALALAGLGFFLALGRWNPVYYLLYLVVPGFDLFRVPARWMMLYTLGMALLAGVGLDALRTNSATRHSRSGSVLRGGILPPVALVIVAVELIFAALALPHTHPTAPQAVYGLRTAPAHLLTDSDRALHPAAAGRFLSMSALTFDPGDMADFRRIFLDSTPDRPAQLDEAAFRELVVALKAQEILAPNLALLWRIPSVDGFDGGVLPLRRYLDLLTLFIPPEELVPDGRLREQVETVPDARLLDLLNVRYVITDKVRDLWFEGIYYDRQIGARLDAERIPTLTVEAYEPFPATEIGVIGSVDGATEMLAALADRSVPVAALTVLDGEREAARFELTAGANPSGSAAHFANDALDSPLAATSGATVAYRDVEGGRQEYLARFTLDQPLSPTALRFDHLAQADVGSLDVVIQAVTLIDRRTGMFLALLPSDRGRFRLAHSGDVKVYERPDALARAYLAHAVVAAASSEEAVTLLRDQLRQPADTEITEIAAIVEGAAGFRSAPAPGDMAEIVAYAPEEVTVRAVTAERSLLVLGDAWYPGWTATVDGAPAPVVQANVLFRGVELTPGEHTVIFRFESQSVRRGLLLSAAGLGLFLALALIAGRRA